MALIKCPSCGEDVSEHAVTCPNCGHSMIEERKKREQAHDFGRLSVAEQQKLTEEYKQIDPTYESVQKIQKRYSFFASGVAVAFFVVAALYYLLKTLNTLDIIDFTLPLLITFVIILIILAVLEVVSIFLLKAAKRKNLEATKKFQNWLKEEKNITYNIILDKKDKKFFNSAK